MTDARRDRGSTESTARRFDFLARAGVGAGVTLLVSLLPVVGLAAPAVGGGVASWTDGAEVDRGSRVGAAAGALVALLSLPLTFLAVALASTVSPVATVGVLGITLVGAAYVVGSGALGGYLADRIAADREASADDATGETPIERLKRRYVDDELSDAEFERRLERLVAADREVEDARSAAGSDRGRNRDRADRDRVDHERESSGRER